MSNLVLADNYVGILSIIKKPEAVSHKTSDKFVDIRDSLIVGTSPAWVCDFDDSMQVRLAIDLKRRFRMKILPLYLHV